VLHVARCKFRTQRWPKIRHLRTIAQLWRAVSSQRRHVSTIEKNLLNSNIFSTYPQNMANFGPLTAENGSGVWDTLPNLTGFASWQRYCTATGRTDGPDGYSSGRQPNFEALNRGRHLYSAGRPSRWALVHILVQLYIVVVLAYLNFSIYEVVNNIRRGQKYRKFFPLIDEPVRQ